MSSADSADAATLARLWIEGHIALFVVLIVSAVLLLVVVVTLLVYCCCCRRKRSSFGAKRQRGESKSSGGNLHIELPADSLDASSAVTATIRGSNTLEIHVDKANHYAVELDQPLVVGQQHASIAGPEIVVVSPDNSASVESVHLQQSSSSAKLHAEYPPLPDLPSGVEVTSGAELQLHGRPLAEVEADLTVAVAASIAAAETGSMSDAVAVEYQAAPVRAEMPMRLPRTEVVLQTEVQLQQQHQKSLHSSPPKAPVIVVSAKTQPQETVIIRNLGDGRPSHEHRHGSSIYQSDDNEITIVDSDFSDYEDSPEDEVRKRASKLQSGLSARISASFDADAGTEEFGWETLPNQPVELEEPPIRAVDRQGQEYIPAPSPSLEQQMQRREGNLAELDRTLDVFEVAADATTSGGGSFEISGRVEVEADVGLVDEEAIQPLDRSQVPH